MEPGPPRAIDDRIRRSLEEVSDDHWYDHSDHLIIALLGGFSGIGGGPFYGTGYYGGGLGLIVVILLILVLLGRIQAASASRGFKAAAALPATSR
jgi:Protein of unknown function (DUF3309)